MRTSLAVVICFCLLLSQRVEGQNKKFESKKLQTAASLLSKEMPYAPAVYQFVENYLSQLLQLGTSEREWRMKADDVMIERGGLDRLHLVNDETSLAMREKDNRYTVNLSNGTTLLIQLSFPMSYQLIAQKKLKDLEGDFIKELSGYPVHEAKAPLPVKKQDMTKTAPHLYMKKGQEYYLEAINNNLYYVEKKGKFSLAYDPGYIAESICNMLISEDTPCEVTLKLAVRQYGFKTDELNITLRQWIEYCKSKGCNLYVGIEKMDTASLKACVFAVNDLFKYNHVMNIEVPYSLLNVRKGEAEASVTIFIPTHNILSLFEELNLNTKKTIKKDR